MLISMVARHAEAGVREEARYAAWAAALRRLREDWARGVRPPPGGLADYVRAVRDEDRSEALADVAGEHLRLAWLEGVGPLAGDYEPAFTAAAATAPADVVEDEFLARHRPPYGDLPTLQDVERRYPGREVAERLRARCLPGERYVLLRRVGLGAMGEVWEASDRRLRRLVAVKRPRAPVTEATARRFAAEARIATRLDHPAIAGAIDLRLEGDGAPFFVTRLVQGRSLTDRIRDLHAPAFDASRSARRLLEFELARAFLSVCEAVAHAHEHGVLHRDLKPGNILLGTGGEAVVADRGLAVEFRGCGAVSGDIVGTPESMAPEQADGRADVRSDVFALGAVLYEILTGRPPRAWPGGVRPVDWKVHVKSAPVIPPRKLNRRAPRALQAICLKALAGDPADRYGNAAEMASEVRGFLAGAR